VFNLLFAFFLVLGAVFNFLSSPIQVRPLTNTVLVIPAVFLLLHILRFLWVLRNRLKISLGMAVATMYNFFSLGWAVTLACIQGLVQKEGVFLRTPKSTTASRAWRAIQVTQWETAIGLICMLAGLLSFTTNPNWRTLSLCLLLFWQGSLYIAAPLYSLFSLNREAALAARVAEQGRPVVEELAARWVVAISMLLIAAFSLIRLLPSPAELPGYARFLPKDVSPNIFPDIFPSQSSSRDERQSSTTPAMATVSVESANCRAKPRGNAEKITILYKGQQAEIVGRNDDLKNPWWYIKIPNLSGNCWLWGMTAKMTGAVEQIPIVK
jgi:hypothetical protein